MSWSGVTITIEVTGGTILRIPAMTTVPTIIFDDAAYSFVIAGGVVLLGGQEVTLILCNIEKIYWPSEKEPFPGMIKNRPVQDEIKNCSNKPGNTDW